MGKWAEMNRFICLHKLGVIFCTAAELSLISVWIISSTLAINQKKKKNQVVQWKILDGLLELWSNLFTLNTFRKYNIFLSWTCLRFFKKIILQTKLKHIWDTVQNWRLSSSSICIITEGLSLILYVFIKKYC